MNLKLAAILAALAAVVVFVALLFDGDRDGSVRGLGVVAGPQPAEVGAELTVPQVEPKEEVAEKSERVEALSVATVEASAPWTGKLAGLTGRVIESDATPVVGIRVALLEGEGTLLFTDMLESEEPSLEIEETLTDQEGRFLLGGARAPAFHGLGIDLGGERATLRMIDSVLPHGVRTDIGDVILAPYGVLLGQVVDEAGLPIAGARVRAAPLPEEILQVPVYDFRSDSMVAVTMMATTGQGHGIIELPPWVQKNIDRLPIPTTFTDDEGAFRLEGVALTKLVGGIDKKGYVGFPIRVDLSSGEEDMGIAVLSRGQTITGMVEDTYGEPQVGIEVFAGAEVVPGVAAILQSCGLTNEDGEFELQGVAEGGQVVAAARRTRHESWSTSVTGNPTDVLVELEANVHLTVNVMNSAGDPLSGARIQMTPRATPGSSGMGFAEILMVMPGNVNREDIFREVEPGKYENERITPGTYDVVARVEGLSPGFVNTEIREEETELTLQCVAGSKLEVIVIDGVTRAPVHDARTSVLRASFRGFTRLDSELSNAEGKALLGPLRDFNREKPEEFFPPETILMVQHPDYGDYTIPHPPPAVPSVTVELQSGGSLTGRVHWGGAVPTRPYMVILEYRGAKGFFELFHPPRFGLSDLEGTFRFDRLAPGEYRCELLERFLDGDPLGLMNGDFNPTTLHREEVEIANGQNTEIEIDLSPTGRGAVAAVKGHVRVDGVDIEGATVVVRGNEQVKTTTDSWGRFQTDDFSILGNVRVTIQGEVAVGNTGKRSMNLYGASLQLENGDVHEVNVDLYPLSIDVQVIDAVSGAPVPQALIDTHTKKHSKNSSGQGFRDKQVVTNDAGQATMLLPRPGEFVLTVQAAGFAQTSSDIQIPEGGLTLPASIQLAPSVPCIGHIAIDAQTVESSRFAYIRVRSTDKVIAEGTVLQRPEYTFEFDGLREGKYDAWIYIDGQRSKTSFVLGPDGERNLVLDFQPQ
ncbi:MAG: hypothetical protein CMJ89_04240 [Planctomycetes bacterium]|nr:hypothetical protein [Planctomycetota bacterium]